MQAVLHFDGANFCQLINPNGRIKMNDHLFHDHSTVRGQLAVRRKRFKEFLKSNRILIPFIFTLGAFAVYFLVRVLPGGATNSAFDTFNHTSNLIEVELAEPGKHVDYHNKDKKSLEFEGNKTHYFFHGFPNIEYPKNVTSISLRNLDLHGPSFADSLKIFENLECITLGNVTINTLENTKRVNLPKLKYFSATFARDQNNNNTEDKEKLKDFLKKVLFFEKHGEKMWDFDRDLANLGVDIKVNSEGLKLLKISQKSGELMLNFPHCNEILKHVKWSYHILTVGQCSINEKILPTDKLDYLNLHKVPLSDEELSRIVKKQTHLKEFLANIPNATINLDDLPKSVNFFSVSGMKVKSEDGSRAERMREFVITDGVLEEKIISNFSVKFPNVDKIGIFNTEHHESQSPHELIKNILKTNASSIYVGNLVTSQSKEVEHYENDTLVVDGESESDGYLEDLGIPKHSKNFIISLPNRGDDRVGIPLGINETRFFQFTLSEKNKVMTYNEYLKLVIGRK